MDSETDGDIRRWAAVEFGTAKLGDERRRSRLISMAARVAQAPSGRVSKVFRKDAERQGAYDFLESDHVQAKPIVDALRDACRARCQRHPFAFVPIDGTSISVVDHDKTKDLGAVGSYAQGGRGLKVIDAIAVSPQGIPLGICGMRWWARPTRRPKHRHPWSASRKVADKETQHWLDAIDDAAACFAEPDGARAWFQLDREGDAWPVLRHLVESGQWFTVRSRSNRRLRTTGGEPARHLQDARRKATKLGHYYVEVPPSPTRKGRNARMELRSSTVTLDLLNAWTKSRYRLKVNVVFAREAGTAPRGEKPLDWTLITNQPAATRAEAQLVVFGYSLRWRIEDFHRSWKSGVCDVESTQLRAQAQVKKWATLLAGVAMRVERLKHLARQQPDLEATVELTPTEIAALVLLKRRQKKETETIPERTPTIAEATRWIADLGGYTGRSSGGPPGSTTIGRGLERVLIAAEILDSLKISEKMR